MTTRPITDLKPAEFADLYIKHKTFPEPHQFCASASSNGVCAIGVLLLEHDRKWIDGETAKPIGELLPEYSGQLMLFACGFDAGFLDSATVKMRLQAEDCNAEFKAGFKVGQELRQLTWRKS